MSDNNSTQTDSTDRTNVHSLLADILDECQPLTTFAKADELGGGRPEMRVDVRSGEVIVDLYVVDDSAVVALDYVAGMCIADTAFTGDVEDAHRAVLRVARHAECEVTHDEFEIAANSAGDDR